MHCKIIVYSLLKVIHNISSSSYPQFTGVSEEYSVLCTLFGYRAILIQKQSLINDATFNTPTANTRPMAYG